jgi:hypothetical protein
MNARTVPLCRRALLQYAIGVAGGVAISCAQPTPAAAGPKISKRAVAYQDHPDGDKQCEKCAQFQPADGRKFGLKTRRYGGRRKKLPDYA